MKRCMTAGFSLVEVALALGVAAVCLTALFALLPVGVASNRAAISETAAANIATAIISDLRTSAKANKASPLGQSVVFGVPLPFSGMTTIFFAEAGQMSGTVNQDAQNSTDPPPRYRATVFFTPQAVPHATVTRLLITWPAFADKNASSAPMNYSGSFEIVTSLDVN